METQFINGKDRLPLFMMLPRFLLGLLESRKLSSTAVIIYTVLYDRIRLSLEHPEKWSDDDGHVFCVYTAENLQKQSAEARKPSGIVLMSWNAWI